MIRWFIAYRKSDLSVKKIYFDSFEKMRTYYDTHKEDCIGRWFSFEEEEEIRQVSLFE